MLLLLVACRHRKPTILIQYSGATIPEVLVPVTDSLVKPVVYTHPVSLERLDIEQRKNAFVDLILPTILIVRFNLSQTLKRVELIALKDSTRLKKRERALIDSLFTKYKTNNLKELQEKLLPHPASLVLAQAAIESAWGTSRFYTEACNIFGLWSFSDDEPRIQAGRLRDGVPVYLRKFDNIYESIEQYYFTIATGPYQDFRRYRMNTSNVYELIPHLHRYSELSSEYTDQIADVIRVNDFTKYDHYRIDPDYIQYN